MTTTRTVLPWILCAALVASVAPAAAKRKAADGAAVERWMVLGPLVDALPAFHDAAEGSVSPKDLLEAPTLPREVLAARPGAAAAWFDGSPTWTEVAVGEDGVVRLDAPRETSPTRPATAWLVAHVRIDRWAKVAVTVPGTRPRALWVDGSKVASGGGEPDADVEATLELAPGRHTVVVRTVDDGQGRGPWEIGLAVRPPKDGEAAPLRWSTSPVRDLTLEDVLDAPRVTSMDLSPDGKLAALAITARAPGASDSESWVEVRRADGGDRVRAWRGAAGLSQVAWAPTGRRLSYVADAPGEKRSTIWVADLDDGSETAVVEGVERLASYAWSPTGDVVVFSTRVDPPKDETGIKRLRNLLDRQADWRTKSRLNMVTVPGGIRREITAGPETAALSAFSPDGKKILFTRNLEDLSERPYTRTELWEMDLATLESRRLLSAGWLGGASYAPDGKRLLLQAGPSAFDGAGATTPPDVIPNDYDGQLYVWVPGTNGVDAITRDLDPAVEEAVWSAADGKIYVRVEDGDRKRVLRYDPASRAFETLDVGGIEVVDAMAVALRAPRVLVRGDGPWARPRVVLVDEVGGTSAVADPAAARLADVRTAEVRPFSFQSPKGRTIDGRVYLPVDFDPSAKYPVIVYYYGGTKPVTRDFGGRYPKEWWAANGYVVYVLQPSGATGYGQEFSALHVNTWGMDTIAEIVEGTKQFLAAHPFADPKRVGCIGASYGGFTTMKLLTESDQFAAAVAHAGISALSSYWGEGYWGYLYSAVATAGSFPWNRRDVYVDQSPLFHADRIKTPLLLTHGADDTNVPPGESDQLFVALRLLGAPVEFLSIAGQNHWIADRDKRIRWSNSIVAWFDRWLKGRPEWWNAMYPEPGGAVEP